jgi:hypothetical protein
VSAPAVYQVLDAQRQRLKLLATLKAECLLWGGTLTEIDGDDGKPLIVISRWALTRCFASLDEVAAWLRRVGARR